MGQGDAFEKIKTGEIAATILIAGKPTGAMGKLRAADGFRFLPVPFAKPLQDDYLPAALEPRRLSRHGRDRRTTSTPSRSSAVLIAYNWPRDSDRYRRIAKFRRRVLSQDSPNCRSRRAIRNGARPISRRWCRAGRGLPAADEWLTQNRQAQPAPAATREQFDQFLAGKRAAGANIGTDSSPEREQLFQQFLQWQARQH